jgi:hypothetical protein
VTSPVQHAARGLFLVFGAALAFFAFVVASGVFGALGQSLISLAFGIAALVVVWVRLEDSTRARVTRRARDLLHRRAADR